jgi:cytochrome c556
MKSIINRRNVVFAFCLLLCGSLVVQAAESDPADMVKYRRSIMKSQREHIAAATAIVQGKVEFKEQLADHVRALEATTGIISTLFPAGSDAGDTLAQPEVWSNRAEFDNRAKDTREKAAIMVKAVAAGDTQNYAAHLNELFESCKSCHKVFRKKVEK